MKMNPRHLWSNARKPYLGVRTVLFSLLVATAVAVFAPSATAQSFSLTPSALTPDNGTVNVGGTAVGSLSVQPNTVFTSVVDLTCTVSSNTVTSNLPVCMLGQDSVTPPATPSITISTCAGVSSTCTGPTPVGVYSVVITGTSSGTTSPPPPVNLALNVVGAVAQDYAISVQPSTATPPTVNPGNSATTTVTVTGIGSYSGSVTVACLGIAPAVEAEPYCTFVPPIVSVTSGGPAPTTTLTITTLGPNPVVTQLFHVPRSFLALFLAFPGIAIAASARGKRRGTRYWMFFLGLSVAATLVLLPACGTNRTNNTQGLTTPKNTYTFTLSATDGSGNGPANAATLPTVTLTVN